MNYIGTLLAALTVPIPPPALDAQIRPSTPPQLTAFVARPDHQAQVQAVAKQTARWQASGCTQEPVLTPNNVIWASRDMAFRPDGVPARGIWVERLTMTGCGQSFTANIGAQATETGLATGPMAPGTSRTDPVVQLDTYRTLMPLIAASLPKCDARRTYVFEATDNGKPPSSPAGAWQEVWVVKYCDRTVTAPIDYAPDGQGGFFIKVSQQSLTIR